MKLFLIASFAALVIGARLDNNYLSPSSSSSGSFGVTNSFGGGLSRTYLSPSSGRSSFESSGQFGSSSPIGSLNQFGSSSRFGSSSQYGSSNQFRSNQGPQIRILKLNNENRGDGNYRFEYETENQIKQQEEGQQKNLGNEQIITVRGSYSYITPEGQQITVNYIADENGFQAQGDHLPTQPDISRSRQDGYQSGSSSGLGGYASNSGYQGGTPNRQYLASGQSNY